MEASYDIIVLGTGLKETLLAMLLCKAGKSILVLDHNSYYGGEAATFSLTQLIQTFRPGQAVPNWTPSREWNVDMTPKLLRGNSDLAALLQSTIGPYFEWQWVDYVSTHQSLPSEDSPKDITDPPKTTFLKDIWDSPQCRAFFAFLKAKLPDSDVPFCQLVDQFVLDSTVVNFLGHAIGQYEDSSFLDRPCSEVLPRLREFSVRPYSNYLYPLYGTGCYYEACTRLCAIYGSTMMLNRPVDAVLFNSNGRVRGVKSAGESASCKFLVCAPSYVTSLGKTRKARAIVRAVCILSHPIPHSDPSGYIVIPQSTVNRHHDIYVVVLSAAHCVCPSGYYIATASTVVETTDPVSELKPAMELLGETLEVFVRVDDYCEESTDERADGLFVLSSLDETGHLEGIMEEVKWAYQGITGKPLDEEGAPS